MVVRLQSNLFAVADIDLTYSGKEGPIVFE